MADDQQTLYRTMIGRLAQDKEQQEFGRNVDGEKLSEVKTEGVIERLRITENMQTGERGLAFLQNTPHISEIGSN